MAVEQDSLNNLTTTSGPTDISAAPLSERNETADRLALLAGLRRLRPESLDRIATWPNG
jgi:hypothetical protein